MPAIKDGMTILSAKGEGFAGEEKPKALKQDNDEVFSFTGADCPAHSLNLIACGTVLSLQSTHSVNTCWV